MIPMEVITFLGSTILGGAMRLIGTIQESKRQERLLTIKALSAKADAVQQAREDKDPKVANVRSITAIMITFSVILLPKLAAIWAAWTGVYLPIMVSYTQTQLKWFGLKAVDTVVWQESLGVMITPLDTHAWAAVGGFFFGAYVTNRRV